MSPGSTSPSAQPPQVVIGGGAAGFFGAIAAAEAGARVTILERSARVLDKVRISGGGRCNVTHRPMPPEELVKRYPRGGRALLGPFHHFGPQDTIDWFAARGVRLKVEADGRMFPTTDDSATIITCLTRAAEQAGVEVRTRARVEEIAVQTGGAFAVRLAGNGETLEAGRLLLAMGGLRAPGAEAFVTGLGHTVEPPVPSLFSLHCKDPRLIGLAGLSVDPAAVSLPKLKLTETGPVLITHEGLSGPAVLRLSAWGARGLHATAYRTTVHVNWAPGLADDAVRQGIASQRKREGARRIDNTPQWGLPRRLWERLVAAAGIAPGTSWAQLGKDAAQALEREVLDGRYEVTGKSLNKDEFVTCGGVRLKEVDFRTMESKRVPGLHFAGEVLDIDGITGGFNFQAAWTTGWLAGRAMAGG